MRAVQPLEHCRRMTLSPNLLILLAFASHHEAFQDWLHHAREPWMLSLATMHPCSRSMHHTAWSAHLQAKNGSAKRTGCASFPQPSHILISLVALALCVNNVTSGVQVDWARLRHSGGFLALSHQDSPLFQLLQSNWRQSEVSSIQCACRRPVSDVGTCVKLHHADGEARPGFCSRQAAVMARLAKLAFVRQSMPVHLLPAQVAAEAILCTQCSILLCMCSAAHALFYAQWAVPHGRRAA